MKKTKFFAWGGMMFALCAMLMVSSCSGDDSEGDEGNSPGGGTVPELPTNGMAYATFTGIVMPGGWGALQGVTVSSGDQTTTTDFNGFYKLQSVKVVNSRAVVKFQKKGYMPVVRSVPVQRDVQLNVSMKECSTSSFSAATPNTLTMGYGTDQMKVELPANGFVTESGTAYSGAVNASSVYLDPDNDNFSEEMPGNLTALRTDNSEAQLISYGMVAVEMTDASGNKLNLAPGKTATLTFPVPEKFKGGTLPATIPLWSFDEETGLWEEEGVATLNGDTYVGQVSHFSWHNLDQPELRATLKVKVLDANGKAVPHIVVNIDGQRRAHTDNDGIASSIVPSNTPMVIWVPSDSYGNYANVYNQQYGYWEYDETKLVKQENVTLSPQETKTITLTMPNKLPQISGKVTNEGTGSQQCLVWVVYGYNETPHYITDSDGNFSLLAPANYTGPATIIAQYGDGYQVKKTFTIGSENVVVNLTANTSATALPFLLRAIGSGLNLAYQLPDPSDECWYAVSLPSGGGLHLDITLQNATTWGGIYMNIPDYDAANPQPSYTSENNTFSFIEEGNGWTEIASKGTLTVNVSKSNDLYTFKISNADANLRDPMKGFDWNNPAQVKFNVEFSARELPQ